MTVIPLRGMRRALSRRLRWWRRRCRAVRTRIKAAELEAERLQQEAMYELACATPLGRERRRQAAARANVAAYERVAGAPFPESAIATLLAALADPERKMEER